MRTMGNSDKSPADIARRMRESSLKPETASCGDRVQGAPCCAAVKERQAAKIRELRQALAAAGYSALDDQAAVLGVGRSTAWTILKGKYKGSGLSVALINRILAAPRLPATARTVILEYIEEKAAGVYGDSQTRISQFIDRVATRQNLDDER